MRKEFTAVFVLATKRNKIGYASVSYDYDDDEAILPKNDAADIAILVSSAIPIFRKRKLTPIDVCALIQDGEVVWEDPEVFELANKAMQHG